MRKYRFGLLFKQNIKILICVILSAIMLTACTEQAVPTQNEFVGIPENSNSTDVSQDADSSSEQGDAQENLSADEINQNLPYRAMWISYLDFTAFDTSSADAFRASAATVFDNCASIGVNTIIFQVRPFSDALYPSTIYPYSHLLTGTQGGDPGFDPLAILIEEAHARNLFFEAWINPYRIALSETMPAGGVAQNSPAISNPTWVREVNGGMYFDPAIPEAQQMIIDGVLEIVNNYDVDGIHFDDYFYPTTDPSFDEETYALYTGDLDLAAWRRENVNTLISNVYSAIKQADPNCVFGISPQGNNDNNYNGQYSDVKLWLSTPGYADYIMPQVYWGFGFTLSNGSQQYAFGNCTNEWASYPKHDDVALAIGMGAYRIDVGDGGTNDQSEWQSGQNLSDMINFLSTTQGVDGYAFYRYANLFDGTTPLQENEKQAIKDTLGLS